MSLPRKRRQAKTFRIYSTFNATGLALAANAEERRLEHRASRAAEAAVGAPAGRGRRGRRTDRHGIPNR